MARSLEPRKIQGEFLNPFDAPGAFTGGATTGGGPWSANSWRTFPLPTGIAGRFTARFDNGGVIGSFGTTKTSK